MSIATSSVAEQTRVKIPDLPALYQRADQLGVTPGWVPREKPIFWPQPKSQFVAARWSYRDIKEALEAAGSLIDVTLADRRNLILRNPFPGNNFETARTFACAYQMILPGELAPSHRHASHALRVIIDAKGAFSIVNGEKMPMETGDVVLTPGWCWHGHGHSGDQAAYWFDGLDIPVTQLLEPMFFEEHPQKYEKIERVVASSPFRFTRDAMAKRLDAAHPDTDGFHGPRIILDSPDIPTMERLTAGHATRRQRSTANQVFVVARGKGETSAGETKLTWDRGDAFVIPTWTTYEHRAASDVELFCMSDEPLMRFAKYYRFEAG
jgi:gentisate 1,2-dioxygenase